MPFMHTLYGIWIDHANATVIKSNELGEMSMEHFYSGVESNKKSGSTSDEHLTIMNQQRHSERRHNEMKEFCREVLKHIPNADELVIFGPGTAKHDLKREVEEHKDLSSKLKGLETTDQLTAAELKEFMNKFFHLPRQ